MLDFKHIYNMNLYVKYDLYMITGIIMIDNRLWRWLQMTRRGYERIKINDKGQTPKQNIWYN